MSETDETGQEREEKRRLREEMEATLQRLDQVINSPEMEAERAAHQRRVEENEGLEEQVESLTEDEQLEFADHVLALMEEHREELRAQTFDGLTVDQLIASLREKKGRMEEISALKSELDGYLYHSMAHTAQARSHLYVAMAKEVRRLEELTDEEWAQMSQEAQTEAADLLTKWQNGWKEVCLSALPIALRRELE